MYLKDTTVLYVEDNLATQQLIKKILSKFCKEVSVASDGLKGLALYKKLNPNIILSDIVMPNMNGIEMSKRIKEINPKQLIALFTAHNQLEFKTKASRLEIDAYIMKPFDEKQFFTSLNYLAMAFHTDLDIKREI